MKIATIIIRTLIGLLLIMSSVVFLLKLVPQPELTGAMKTFNEGLEASGYIMTLVKLIELFCGLAFVTGFYVALANVIIFPIVVNIVLVHAFLAPEGLPIAIALLLGNLFLAYRHKEKYNALFSLK